MFFRKNKDKMKVKPKEPNKLQLYRRYTYYGGYSSENKEEKITEFKIFDRFRRSNNTEDDIFIQSLFNGVVYPVFDLDEIQYKETFEDIFKDKPYVLFSSSPDHHWAILADPNPNILQDTIWSSCNDPQYVSFARQKKKFLLRALYENTSRKPVLVHRNKKEDFSDNFNLFIKTFISFINNQALELSVLKYKTPELILKFERKKKLLKIEENENS